MNKPAIFFSHSSRDQIELKRLKEIFVDRTGGSIEVFLSSDGQSIPLGRNWVHKIQEALQGASLMVVFVSPNSLRSSWLFFESGFAYSKDIRVVPVGFLGVDLANIPPPISLLQGFNISSEAGLNNLIAVANDVFGHSHVESFTADDFGEICLAGTNHSNTTFGDNGRLIDNVMIRLWENKEINCTPKVAIEKVKGLLVQEKIEFESSHGGEKLGLHGISIQAATGYGSAPLTFMVDPGLADISLPIVEKAIGQLRTEGVNGVKIQIAFVPTVGWLDSHHKLTGRLYGTDIELAPEAHFLRGDIDFHLSELPGELHKFDTLERSSGTTIIDMVPQCNHIPQRQIRDLLSFLFERNILFLAPEHLN